MLRQQGGPTISEGVQIFLKYEIRGVQIFRNIWTGGIQRGGVQIFHDSTIQSSLYSVGRWLVRSKQVARTQFNTAMDKWTYDEPAAEMDSV